MTEKTPVQREIKPNPKQPIQINTSGRTFKGSTIIVTGQTEKGKDIEEIVESKTRFIPAQIVAMLFSGDNQKAKDKIESKLVPLASASK